jgi:hypothetical protein
VKRTLHALLVVLSAIPWAIGCITFACAWCLVILADRVWPDADRGNCWSYAGARWRKYGGYLLIRPADGLPLIPHAVWVPNIPPGLVVRQTLPVSRVRRWWQAWQTVYFRFRVLRRERSHDARWIDSNPAA